MTVHVLSGLPLNMTQSRATTESRVFRSDTIAYLVLKGNILYGWFSSWGVGIMLCTHPPYAFERRMFVVDIR